MWFDTDAIKQDLTPIAAAKSLGLKIVKRGATTFVECPAHPYIVGKRNKNISCCQLGETFDHAFRCYGCGTHGSVFDMIKWKNGLTDFKEIINSAAELAGDPDDYKLNKAQQLELKKENDHRKELLITPDEFKYIGLDPSVINEAVKILQTFEPWQVSEDSFDKDRLLQTDNSRALNNWDVQNNGTYLYDQKRERYVKKLREQFPTASFLQKEDIRFNINIMERKDHDLFTNIIKGKCVEKMHHIKAVYDDVNNGSVKNIPTQEVLSELKNRYMKTYNIFCRFSNEDEICTIDLTWIYNL